MNILFLDSIDKATYGGMEEWIRLVATGLVQRGHEVTIVGRPDSAFLTRLDSAHTGATLLPLDISGDFHPGTIAALAGILKEKHIDVIVVNFNKDIRLGGLAARLGGEARVVWSVGLDITKDSFIHRFLTPKLVDGVLVPSQSLKRQITRLGNISPDTVEVIPIGIPDHPAPDKTRARARLVAECKLPENSVIAISVARLVDQKGHRYLVDAIPALVERHPDLRFIWCGSGPLQSTLEAQSEALGVRQYITFAGMLTNTETVFAAADILIHPSVDEPFGIAVLEGMRAGLPIVASNVGGIPEVLDNTGLLVEPANPAAFAGAISRVLSDPILAQDLGAAARLRFEQSFNIASMFDQIERYLHGILQTEKRHG